jgi:predicted RNA-binding protein with RPS1 domain
VLKVGEEVEVYVLRIDRDRKRIGLSLKRLQPDPWHVAEEKYEVGQIVKGTITNIVDFGAFARIEDGIEGLIHVTELSDGDFAPRDLVREGEELYVKILSMDGDRQRMGLSLKQAPSREEVEGEGAWAEIAEEGEAGGEPALDVSLAETEEEPTVQFEPEVPLSVEPEMEVEAELAAAFDEGVSPEAAAEVVIAEVAVEVEDRGLEPELEQAPSQEEPEVEEPAGDGEGFELEAEAEQDEELPVDVESVMPTAPEAEVLAEEEAEAESKSEAEEEEALNDTVVSEEQAEESDRPEELVGVATEADSDEADLTPDESTAVDPDETEQDEDV